MAFQKIDYSASQLFGQLIGLVFVSDADLVDDRRCFACDAQFHSFWKRTRDILVALCHEYDYTKSPRFAAYIEGKSEQYIAVATRIASQKRTEHRQALGDALMNALSSDFIFELTPLSVHDELRWILQTVTSMDANR